MFAAGSSHAVTVWNVSTGEVIAQFPEPAAKVCFSWNNTKLAAVASRTIRVWDMQSQQLEHKIEIPLQECVQSCCFTSVGDKIIAAVRNIIFVFDLVTSDIVIQIHLRSATANCVCFGAHHNRILGGMDDGRFMAWEVDSGENICDQEAHHLGISALKQNNSGTRCATASTDERIIVWDTVTWQMLKIFELKDRHALNIGFRDDGTLVYYIDQRRRVVLLRSTSSVELFSCWPGNGWDYYASSPEFSTDGRKLIVKHREGLAAHNVITGERLQTFADVAANTITCMACSFPSAAVLL
jgi:WD40 repeat protein